MHWSSRSEWIVPGLAQILEIVLDAAGEQRDLTLTERDTIFATGETAHEAGGSLSQLIEAYLSGGSRRAPSRTSRPVSRRRNGDRSRRRNRCDGR